MEKLLAVSACYKHKADHRLTFSKTVVAGPLQLPPATSTPPTWVPEPLLHPGLLSPLTACLSCVVHVAT